MSREPSFAHLASLSTPSGLFEHAHFRVARRDHGFCLDDVARGLVVTARQPAPSSEVAGLAEVYLRFSIAALVPDGRFHNRRRVGGSWSDRPSTNDHWGRGIWGLGTAAAYGLDQRFRDEAARAAGIALQARSRYPRAMAYAALGAADLLLAQPGHRGARHLLLDASDLLDRPGLNADWPWPEPRLRYANAVLPEALIAIGSATGAARTLDSGLMLLRWLVAQETRGDHLSVTPSGGWFLGEPRPGFDQQPIEVSALAEACWRAYEVTGENSWLVVIDLAADWFEGANDLGVAVYDPASGGCCDGLHADRVNLNHGAESTLAALATLQLARRAARLEVS